MTTIRAYAETLYANAAPAPTTGVPRIDQLNALALYARSQLDNAFHDCRHTTISAISRLLFNCHSLLSRLEERHTVAAPTEKDLEYQREEDINHYAVSKLLRAHPELEDEFLGCREKVIAGDY